MSSRRRAAFGLMVTAVAVATVLLACAWAASALANWSHVSSTRSAIQPYFVCPAPSRAARCELVEDPTRGTHKRGPLPAGAITRGPEQEVSPATHGTGVEGGYSPSDLQRAYALLSSSAGSGQTVAVVDAFDDPNAEADLAVYRSEYGLGSCNSTDNCFRKVNQSGGTAMPAPNEAWAQETSLDLDMVSAICPNCHILLVEANNEEPGNLAAAENEAVRLGATEVSNSFEEPESSVDASAYDHPGVPIAAAGGDKGYGAVSPAANPHVIAVGGTTLLPAENRRGWSETVWYSESAREGTGSGCSREPKPAWQTDAGCTHRTTNDIAAVADPNTPVSAYDSYHTAPAWKLLGGTSVSAPIVAATMALATPYTRSFDGAQALYLEGADTEAFNDVVSGLNGHCAPYLYLCEAGPGYDGPTGLGTLRGAPEVPPPAPTTTGARGVTTTQATLLGAVNPHGVPLTECRFQYGTTLAYEASVPCSTLPGAQSGLVSVSAVASGLTPSTAYHFRLTVSFAGGSSAGEGLAFSTAGLAPSVYEGETADLTTSSANLNASVSPNGDAVTACDFEYGRSASYGSAAACSPVPGQGFAAVSVSATVAGLAANSTYHYRVRATNANGTAYGADRTFTLPPLPPTVTTHAATSIGRTSATLNAIVDANGAPLTACAFEFNSSETLVPCAAAAEAQSGPTAVSAAVSGLRPGSAFRYRILATNAGGTTYGALAEFTSLPSASQLAARAAASLASTNLLAEPNGTLRVEIRCPSHRTRCRGTITLRTRVASGPSSAILASATFTVSSGRVIALRLRLTGFARSLLARTHTVTAIATVRTSAGGGVVSARRARVTVRSHRAA